MQIEMQARNYSLTQSLRTHIERRLGYSLGSCCRTIKRLLVRLSDINGPRGGNDHRCHLQLILPGHPVLVVQDTEADLYLAINRATARAGQAVMRRLGRRRDSNRYYPLAGRALSQGAV